MLSLYIRHLRSAGQFLLYDFSAGEGSCRRKDVLNKEDIRMTPDGRHEPGSGHRTGGR